MGYALLWIENLAVLLLLVALILACAGRLRRRWLRHAVWAIVTMALLVGYVALVVSTLLALDGRLSTGKWFFPLLALTLSFGVGMAWLWHRGLRHVDEGPSPTVAGSWPRGKLAIVLGVAVAFQLITIWNVDLAVRQQLETLRGEAGALSLSVAPPRVPDRDNAATIYERAFEDLRRVESREKISEEKWRQWADPGQTGLDVKDSDLRRHLQSHAATIGLVNRAAAKSGCYFEHDYQWPTAFMLLPDVQYMDHAARLLALDARVEAANGNMRAALRDINAAFAIAQHISAEPMLVALIMSCRVEQTTAEALQQVLANKSASSDDLAVMHIDERPSHQRLLQRDLRFEEAMGLTTFYQFSRGELELEQFTQQIMTATPKHPVRNSVAAAVYRLFLFTDDLADYRRLSRRLQELAAKPYYQARSELTQFTRQHTGSTGPLTRTVLPAIGSCAEKAAQADALRQAVQLALAAAQYRARNGKLPARLDDLVPDFISLVPVDPFDGKPMRMKRTEHGLTIYSIGPDMVDNGGSPWNQQKQTGDITFELTDKKPQGKTSENHR